MIHIALIDTFLAGGLFCVRNVAVTPCGYVAVIGAERGVGLELCRLLVQQRVPVLACCVGSASDDLLALGSSVAVIDRLDPFAPPATTHARLARECAGRVVDTLVHAHILRASPGDDVDISAAHMNKLMAHNALFALGVSLAIPSTR